MLKTGATHLQNTKLNKNLQLAPPGLQKKIIEGNTKVHQEFIPVAVSVIEAQKASL